MHMNFRSLARGLHAWRSDDEIDTWPLDRSPGSMAFLFALLLRA